MLAQVFEQRQSQETQRCQQPHEHPQLAPALESGPQVTTVNRQAQRYRHQRVLRDRVRDEQRSIADDRARKNQGRPYASHRRELELFFFHHLILSPSPVSLPGRARLKREPNRCRTAGGPQDCFSIVRECSTP